MLAIVLAGSVYWVATAEVACGMIVAPSLGNHPHFLVGFTLRFPSELYSKLVRIENATYVDHGGSFVQENSWVYEEPTYAAISAHESTLTGLRVIDSYAPQGRQSTGFLFKLRNGAYVGPAETPLQLPTGPYSVTIRYRVLWFVRTVTFNK